MARRTTGAMNGERYLGNVNNREVHDLDNEDTKGNGCQVDEILAANHEVPFDTLSQAYAAGYDDCDKCLPGSER